MQAIDDRALLRQYVTHHSEAAFETLVSKYTPLVYSAALRQTRDPHLAGEATQAVFIILAQKAGRMSDSTILSGWLFKTTRFVAMAQIRTAARRRFYEQESRMQEEQAAPPNLLWEQISPLLDEALTQLGEKDRQAILLRYFEDKNLAEIGNSLDTGEDAARMRINRALEKLRRFFNRRGISSTTILLAGAISTHSVQAEPAMPVTTITAVAVAKGAAASSSTLALVTEALRLMAWTKAKTAVITTALTILAVSTMAVAIEKVYAWRVARYPDIQGAWEGLMHLDDAGIEAGEAASTRVVLKLTKTNDSYSATTDWIEKGRHSVPMGRVVYDYPSLQIERSSRDIWKLTVNAQATEMVLDHSIHFIQPDPVVLKRTASPAPTLERLTEADFTPRAGSDLQGYWKGEIGIGDDAVPVNVKIAEQSDGTFRAEGDDPMRGANGQPATVTYDRSKVTFTLASGAGRFQGKINKDKTEAWGSWIQNGQSTTAVVRRADYQAEHLQEPLKNYSFNSEGELQGHWKGSWVVSIAKTKATIRMALDIAKLPDGTYSATLVNVDEFWHNDPIPPSDFQFSPPHLHMEWKWTGGAFEGKLQNGKLDGVWQQGGGGFPLVFTRESR